MMENVLAAACKRPLLSLSLVFVATAIAAGVHAALRRRLPAAPRSVCILLDNGSLRAASVVSLRDIAARVSARAGCRVVATSARISDRIPAGEVAKEAAAAAGGDGAPADVLATAVARLWGEGYTHFLILPAFLGPSDTLSQFVPEVMAAARAAGRAGLSYSVAGHMVQGGGSDTRVARAVADRVRALMAVEGLGGSPPAVAVCDHGSPSPAVTAVRDHIAAQVRAELAPLAVTACSMERRPDPAYDFNEPTLEHLLRAPGYSSGTVVVAMLFISPGKHAGAGGDVATIIAAAEAEAAAEGRTLRAIMTPLLGTHEALVDVLVDRLREAQARDAGWAGAGGGGKAVAD
jgi:sirohydrochlorin ferrochelatase